MQTNIIPILERYLKEESLSIMQQTSRVEMIQTLLKVINDDYVFNEGDHVIYIPHAKSTSLFMAGRLGTIVSILHKNNDDVQYYGVNWDNKEKIDEDNQEDIPWSAVVSTCLRKYHHQIPEHYGLHQYYLYNQSHN